MQPVYTGVGSRRAPPIELERIRRVARRLAELGWTLRSGGAEGCDDAFEAGCDTAGGAKEIFLPWPGFRGRQGIVMGDNLQAALLAAQYHPRWKQLTLGERKLHTRNVAEVLGPRLDRAEASVFAIVWTPGGRGQGGTGQAIRIARAYQVPVVDLACPGALSELARVIHAFPTCRPAG